ncbi:gp58-like family protein [Streptococcus suis]|uniref:gp58-like family protein n=1 Tax=Streptococcus suis TaxID=1307 RepID=UPI0038BA3695
MLTFLDHKRNEIGALTTFKFTNSVNGERSLSGTVHGNLEIEKGWGVRFEDEYYKVIYAKPKSLGKINIVQFDAIHQFFWDFDKSSVYSELDGSYPFRTFLDHIFNGSGYRYNLEVEVGSLRKQNFGLKKRLELFNDLIKHAGVEFQVRGKVVRILERTGTDLSTVVRKKLNLNDLSIEKRIGDFITYQKGLGAWYDENDHSKGRLEVEYVSPLATIYGRLEGEPYVDERFTIAENFLGVLKKSVEDSYSISVQLSMEDLQKAGYQYTRPLAGDYITVIDEDINFKERVRIVSVETEYDIKGQVIDHTVTCNDIGSVKKQSVGYSSLKSSVSNVSKETESAIQTANKALVSADGKSTVYFGTEFPQDVPKGTLTKGDTLYLKVGDKTKMYYWNGAEWLEPPVVNDVEAFKESINTEIAQVNQSMQAQAQEHDRQVADILSKTQSVEALANQAKSDAANALASATQLKADAVNEAQRLVNTLKTETVASSNQLKQQIETVGNQLSSQQAELLLATQTVRGLDTQVKSVANQLGTQQTTITQLVNDGNARGQKIADFETSLDGVTTKLQNLWNGSRNLLSNTELLTGYDGVLPYPKNHYLNKAVFRWTHKATDTAFKEGLVMQVNDTLVNPKEMIVSFYAVANRSTTIRCYMFNPNGRKAVETSTGYTATNVDGYAEVTIGTAWRRYWVRYTYQVGYVAKPYVIIGRSPDTVTADSTVSIVAPALYHGHYNRDWQPSDVDIVSDFAIYKQTIDQNLAQLGSDIRTANGSVTSLRTEYNQTKAEIALLASKSDFDALTQKTQSLEASLKVQAGKIDLKAEKTSIDTINQQISSAQAELTVVNDAIAQRVTKTDFNAVKRTAEANATAITQVNNAIELKAEKTYVEGVKSTADSALAKANTNASTITQTKAELKIANDAIDTKATKIDLNNLTGRMSTAETTIRTQAGQIEQRLTATQVNELVDGKGYATSSSVQNIVKETADSFSRTISAVENKIPTEAGGTNLVRGSADLKQGANGWREGHWRNSGSGGTVEYNATLPSSPVKGIVKGVKIVNNNNNQIGLCQDGIALEPGTYTMSVWVIGSRGLKVHISGAYSQDTSNPFASGNTFVTLGRYGWTLISQTFTLDKRYENLTLGYMMLDSTGTVYFAAPYIHKSSMSGDWSPAVEDLATVTALHEVKDTVSSHTRTISDQGQAISQVVQTANGLVQEVSGANGLKNQVSQLKNSWAVKLSGPDGLKTAINASTDGIRLLGKNIRLDGNTLIDNGIIKSAMIGNGQIGTAHIGTIDASVANIINLNANKITGLDANFIKSKIELAIIDWMKGKTIVAQNGNMNIDLNNSGINMFKDGVIRFYSGSNAIYRQSADGIHTGFVHFDTTSKGGIYASLGSTSSRDGINSKSSGRFAGIRVARTSERSDSHVASQDAVELYGDTIFFGHGFEGGGFSMHTTLTGGKTISLNKIHDAIINLCRCWIHLRNVGFNPNDAAFKRSLDVELGQAQQLYNEIERIT